MKASLKHFLLLSLISLPIRGTAAASPAEEEEVRETLHKSALGFEQNDIGALSQVWATDESLTVFENGSADYGWTQYRDHHLIPEMAEMKNTRYKLTDIRPRVFGTTAWATFKYSITADFKGRHIEGEGLGTDVLEKQKGKWRIVHWNSCATRRSTPSSGEQG
ncbi:MAG: nuclear transport factor 2 family protein [Acidobacteria bacterium]|nr:nuclear transport factor 2 family protein [Acidobacteriota bacterium]